MEEKTDTPKEEKNDRSEKEETARAAASGADEVKTSSSKDPVGTEKKAAPQKEKKETPPPAPTPLEKAQSEMRSAQERYLRTMADFDNFRKRTARDREELVKQASAEVLKDVLGTVDDLALALGKAEKADDPFVTGVKMVYDNLMKTLANHGATPVDSLGEPFDANFHEALAQLPDADVPEGHIVNEVKRGWLLNGKLLRVAQVVVSSGKPA